MNRLLRVSKAPKSFSLGKETEQSIANAAGCTTMMVRHVLRWGLGQNPSPERASAYRELHLRGKLP